MPLLFSYGTLQEEKVQLSTFGRLLQGQRDELPGFEPSSVEDPQVAAVGGKAHHANVTFNGRSDIEQRRTTMDKLEVSARMTIRKGKLEGFKRQAAECIRQTKEKDTKTLRYDWFLGHDETECEIREAYVNSEGLVEHRMHIGEALDKLFSEFAENHTVVVYGDPSPRLLEMARRMPQGSVKWYSFLRGLES
jgi:quinol monooxygenase YgiN